MGSDVRAQTFLDLFCGCGGFTLGMIRSDLRERDAIYADPEAGEEEFLRAADLEAKYAEYGGYIAEARANQVCVPASRASWQPLVRQLPSGWRCIG